MVREKRWSLNQDKAVCLVEEVRQEPEAVRQELEASPLLCSDFETKLVQCDKWLGDYFHSGWGAWRVMSGHHQAPSGKKKGR